MTIRHGPRWRALTLTLPWLLASGAAGAEALRAVAYGWTVDTSRRAIDSFVMLDRAPDFTSRDGVGRLADQLQYWFDDRADVDAQAAGYQRASGWPVDGTQTLLSWEDAASGELVVRRISADFPGWGPEIGRVAYRLDAGHRLEFSVPWTLLATDDGAFSSAFEAYRYGGWGGQTWSTWTPPPPPPVPEPATWAMLAAGLGALAWRARRAPPASPAG